LGKKLTQPPPPPKGFSKTAKIAIAIIIIASVALASTAAVLLSRPTQNNSQNNTPPDISGVKIQSTSTDWTMVKAGLGFENGIPVDNYDLNYYIVLQISNPTNYTALLKIYGEANISVSYLALSDEPKSFSLTAYQTQNFTIPPYSLDYYKIPLFYTAKNCDVPSSMKTNITNVVVNELYREAVGT
jgi:hypothetical protein